MNSPSPDAAEAGCLKNRGSLELERLGLENEKLKLELERMRTNRWDYLQRLSPLLGGLLALAGFVFGVIQYVNQQETNRVQAKQRSDQEIAARAHEVEMQTVARDQEFMKPLWEREITTYFRASETVATLARTRDAAKRRAAEEEFWRLYQGPLVILETKALSDAMVSFGNCLDGQDRCSDVEVKNRALAVSSAIQQAIQEHSARRLSEFSKDKFQYHR
jgi:hypothetical protein